MHHQPDFAAQLFGYFDYTVLSVMAVENQPVPLTCFEMPSDIVLGDKKYLLLFLLFL